MQSLTFFQPYWESFPPTICFCIQMLLGTSRLKTILFMFIVLWTTLIKRLGKHLWYYAFKVCLYLHPSVTTAFAQMVKDWKNKFIFCDKLANVKANINGKAWTNGKHWILQKRISSTPLHPRLRFKGKAGKSSTGIPIPWTGIIHLPQVKWRATLWVFQQRH